MDESRLGNSAASGSMRDVAVLSSSQMKSIQGLVGNTLEQSVLSTVELQRMKDTASGEIERREAAAKQASQAAKAELRRLGGEPCTFLTPRQALLHY